MARNRNRRGRDGQRPTPTFIRIVGGSFRGRKLKYAGDTRVRPMKDRVRESLFNLLGPAVKGTYAIDLFGGTGALALEAVSRGAARAVILERHLPTAKVIRQNIATLDLDDRVQLVIFDAFAWLDDHPSLPASPWVVFFSPPYRFFVDRTTDLLALIADFADRAPIGSLIAVEATAEFDFAALPYAPHWDVRSYPPAVLAVLDVTSTIRRP